MLLRCLDLEHLVHVCVHTHVCTCMNVTRLMNLYTCPTQQMAKVELQKSQAAPFGLRLAPKSSLQAGLAANQPGCCMREPEGPGGYSTQGGMPAATKPSEPMVVTCFAGVGSNG